MQMEKMVAANPQKTFLFLPWRAKREIKAIAEKTERANRRSPIIFAFSFLGAYIRKMTT